MQPPRAQKSHLTTPCLPRLAKEPGFEVGVKLTGRLADPSFKHLDWTLEAYVQLGTNSIRLLHTGTAIVKAELSGRARQNKLE